MAITQTDIGDAFYAADNAWLQKLESRQEDGRESGLT
jgi:hypothetical protein